MPRTKKKAQNDVAGDTISPRATRNSGIWKQKNPNDQDSNNNENKKRDSGISEISKTSSNQPYVLKKIPVAPKTPEVKKNKIPKKESIAQPTQKSKQKRQLSFYTARSHRSDSYTSLSSTDSQFQVDTLHLEKEQGANLQIRQLIIRRLSNATYVNDPSTWTTDHILPSKNIQYKLEHHIPEEAQKHISSKLPNRTGNLIKRRLSHDPADWTIEQDLPELLKNRLSANKWTPTPDSTQLPNGLSNLLKRRLSTDSTDWTPEQNISHLLKNRLGDVFYQKPLTPNGNSTLPSKDPIRLLKRRLSSDILDRYPLPDTISAMLIRRLGNKTYIGSRTYNPAITKNLEFLLKFRLTEDSYNYTPPNRNIRELLIRRLVDNSLPIDYHGRQSQLPSKEPKQVLLRQLSDDEMDRYTFSSKDISPMLKERFPSRDNFDNHGRDSELPSKTVKKLLDKRLGQENKEDVSNLLKRRLLNDGYEKPDLPNMLKIRLHDNQMGVMGQIRIPHFDEDATVADILAEVPYSAIHLRLGVYLLSTQLTWSCMFNIIPLTLPSISQEFNLTKSAASLSACLLMLGGLCGTIVGSFGSDLYGRKKMHLCAGISALTLLIAQITTPSRIGLFFTLRFMLGICFGLGISTKNAYFMEFLPIRRRGVFMMFMGIGWSLGNFYCIILASLFQDWRWCFLGTMLPIVTYCAMLLTPGFLPESPRWLFVNGREEEGRKIISNMWGGRVDCSRVCVVSPKNKRQTKIKEQLDGTWRQRLDMILSPQHINATMLCCLCYVCISGGNYGLSTWKVEFIDPTHAAIPAIGLVIVELTSILFAIPGAFLAEKLGRRPLLCMGFFGSMASMCGGVLISSAMPIHSNQRYYFLIMFIALTQGTTCWVWDNIQTMTLEMFPTYCRGTAVGLVNCCNRLSATIFTYVIGLAIEISPTFAFSLLVFLFMCGGFSALRLPETSQIKMQDIADEDDTKKVK